MSVATPNPPVRPGEPAEDDLTLDERVSELEALIEEARQLQRKRRRRNAAIALVALTVAGAAVYAGGDGIRAGKARSADRNATPAATTDRGGAWSNPAGPPGFDAKVVLHPAKRGALYLSAGGRVFRSTNGGRTWSSGRAIASRVDALVVDPRRGSTLYAGTGDGVLRSTDGGSTWRRLGLAPPPAKRAHARVEGAVYGVEVDPADSRIVFAQTGSDLFRSTNGGTSWRKLLAAPPRSFVTAFASRPSAATLYAAVQLPWTDDQGHAAIRRSTDNGRTWHTVARRAGTIGSLTVDTRPGTVWATGTAGVLVTRDGGTTWRAPGRAPGSYPGPVVVDARHPGTVYVSAWEHGLFRSTDDGASWRPFGTDPDLAGLVIDPRQPRTMYAGDGAGVVKTADGGATWRRADAGITASDVGHIAPAASSAATVYASTSLGLSRSDDQGRTWTAQLHPDGNSIAVDPRDHRHVLVGGGSGILASRNGGASWVTAKTTQGWTLKLGPNSWVPAIAFDAQDPRLVYAGVVDDGAPTTGLIRSSDGGKRWEWVQGGPSVGQALTFAVHPTRSGTMYAGGANGLVGSSTDGGLTWQYRSIPVATQVWSISIARSEPDTLYAASGGGLARSVDGGDRWKLVPVRARGLRAVAVDPARADTVYVGTEDRGVLRSTDGGTTWRPFGTRLSSRSISTLAFDATGTVLYAGTNGAGLTSIRVR